MYAFYFCTFLAYNGKNTTNNEHYNLFNSSINQSFSEWTTALLVSVDSLQRGGIRPEEILGTRQYWKQKDKTSSTGGLYVIRIYRKSKKSINTNALYWSKKHFQMKR